jgi:Tol biopolymer transport system component
MTSVLLVVLLHSLGFWEASWDAGARADPAIHAHDQGESVFALSCIVDGNEDIHVVNLDAGQIRRLTTADARDTHPTWSPDGTRIAFMSDRDGDWEIYVMNADGTGQRRITNHPANDLLPRWSPSGEAIGFVSHGDGNSGIYTIGVDGDKPTRLGRSEWDVSFPTWSPDGRRIAFFAERDGTVRLYVMSSDGSDPKEVVVHCSLRGNSIDWKP